MAILTLDLGTTTGFCLKVGGATVSGTWNLKPGRFEGGGMRFVRFRAYLDSVHLRDEIKVCFFEEVRAHKGVDAAHIYGGLLAMLSAWCETHNVPYGGVPVGTIKKFMTGKGNAGKPEMIAAVRKHGFSPVDDNEADAIALMLFKLESPEIQELARGATDGKTQGHELEPA